MPVNIALAGGIFPESISSQLRVYSLRSFYSDQKILELSGHPSNNLLQVSLSFEVVNGSFKIGIPQGSTNNETFVVWYG